MGNEEKLRTALEQGELELQGQFTLGSNYTFLVSVRRADETIQAVYKPQKGEMPLWDFPENSLAGREVAAYLVSQALDWELVPLTIFRQDGPFGPGSLQQFIEYNPNYHYFTFRPEDKARLLPVALFDHLTNNADRKGSHIIVEKGTRRLYAIDHGLCFNVDDKLRTVIWDFAGNPIPEELTAGLARLRAELAGPSLPTALSAHLAAEEIRALDARAEALITAGSFPQPPPYRRAYPYPPL
jgi:uncharacterized repeat protein (TIGR03843 family)